MIPFSYNTPILKIPSATSNPKDFAQNIIKYGKVQHNLCGEFCVAYCAQDEAHMDNIDDFLNYWEVSKPSYFKTLFKNFVARTTGIYDLEQMLYLISQYDYKLPALRLGGIQSNAFIYQAQLESYQAIAGVKIDNTGYLVGSGIPHWVVIESITIYDVNHAIVNIYNPSSNMIEPYSWREFMNSTGAYKNGIWIER